jgi:hypothetical protein
VQAGRCCACGGSGSSARCCGASALSRWRSDNHESVLRGGGSVSFHESRDTRSTLAACNKWRQLHVAQPSPSRPPHRASGYSPSSSSPASHQGRRPAAAAAHSPDTSPAFTAAYWPLPPADAALAKRCSTLLPPLAVDVWPDDDGANDDDDEGLAAGAAEEGNRDVKSERRQRVTQSAATPHRAHAIETAFRLNPQTPAAAGSPSSSTSPAPRASRSSSPCSAARGSSSHLLTGHESCAKAQPLAPSCQRSRLIASTHKSLSS